MSDLVKAAKTVGLLTRDRLQSGQIPVFLGVPGLLALLYDKIRRFNQGAGKRELLELASDAFVIAMIALEESPADQPTQLPDPVGYPASELPDEELLQELREENESFIRERHKT